MEINHSNRNWLTKISIYRKPGELYLTRYVLVKTKWFCIYVHQFHLSDFTTPHCHPWWWFAMPVLGGYLEHFMDGTTKRRKPFRPVIRGPREAHWVELFPGTAGKVWTIFMTGPRVREWGFYTKEGFVLHSDYSVEK